MATDPTRPPSDEDRAKSRFFIINAMRFAGVLMVIIGILVVRDVVDLPDWTAWVLIPLGFIEAFVTPQILARMWSTRARADLEGGDVKP